MSEKSTHVTIDITVIGEHEDPAQFVRDWIASHPATPEDLFVDDVFADDPTDN
jgi:hypothetical protein